jgi:hypothetical protein
MSAPETPKDQMDRALAEAWEAADKCKALLEQNNQASAAVWAAASSAWSAIALAVSSRLQR